MTQESHPDLGTITYQLNANGSRTSRNQNGTVDYYGVDAGDKLVWVNQGVNAAPTAGQAAPYTLFFYNLNGVVSQRDRRYIPAAGCGRCTTSCRTAMIACGR